MRYLSRNLFFNTSLICCRSEGNVSLASFSKISTSNKAQRDELDSRTTSCRKLSLSELSFIFKSVFRVHLTEIRNSKASEVQIDEFCAKALHNPRAVANPRSSKMVSIRWTKW